MKIYRKLHRWPGLIISFILLYYAITGIFMNHREQFSGIDVDRDWMPKAYQYKNWNNAALKGNIFISKDSVLFYGNIGIWLCDSSLQNFQSFNYGLPYGSDNRKIFDIHQTSHGDLYSATQFGLFGYDRIEKKWKKFDLEVDIARFTAIESIGDTVYAINRSYLFKGWSQGVHTKFQKIELAVPQDYVNEVSLFETLWQLHSGEIFGLLGQLFVDLMGIVTAFLSITGIIYFFFPNWIKRRVRKEKPAPRIIKINRWSLKWHNKLGAWTFVFLIILFFTGIFLRPPLLIAIANANISPLKFSHLDQPNPWYDKLRDMLYDKEKDQFLLSTSEGMYYFSPDNYQPVKFHNQPPVSVMGINTFEPFGEGAYLIASFSGIFLWHPNNPVVLNYAKGTVHEQQQGGRPVGDYKVSGTITDYNGRKFMIDYDKGAIPLWHNNQLPSMPKNMLEESNMSLWNACLEIHTGRFFQGWLGIFYILIVPLTGLAGIVVVISGYMLWRRKYRKLKGDV